MSNTATFKKAKSLILGIFLLGLVVMPTITLVTAQPVFAADTPPTSSSTADTGAKDIVGLGDRIGLFIGNFILNIASMITWAGGRLLETSIDKLVLNMGANINTESIGGTIDSLWTVIRDISNLAFIFGFIYIGIRTIIDANDSDTKRWLASIIIGALLINFSLLIVKMVIDISNYTAVEIFKALTTSSTGADVSISAKVADVLRIGTLFSPQDGTTLAKLTLGGSISFFFMGSVLLMVAGFVFAAGGILLIVRYVALIFIMIFSPILFAATVFPQTADYAKKLWGYLFSYSFFAPVYLLLLIVAIRMLEGIGKILNTGTLAEAISNKTDTYSVILNFSIAIMFLIMALQAASKLGVMGGDKAVSIGNSLRGKAQSFAGRNTIGWASAKALKGYEALDDKAANSKGVRGAALKVIRGTVATAAGGDRNLRDTLGSGKKAKFGGDYSYADDKSHDEERSRRQAKVGQVTTVSDAVAQVTTHDKAAPGTVSEADKDKARMKMEQAVAGASTEQMLALLDKHSEGSPEHTLIVANMSAGQFDNIMKSKPEDFDDKAKAKLGEARAKAVSDRLIETEKRKLTAGLPAGAAAPVVNIDDVIGKANGKDLEALGFDKVYEHAGLLTTKQLDDMGSLTPTAKARLSAKRNQDLIDAFTSAGVVSARATFENFKDNEAAKLPGKILTHADAAEHLNVNILNKILDNDSLTAAERTAIKTNVMNHHRGTPTEATFDDFFKTPLGKRYG